MMSRFLLLRLRKNLVLLFDLMTTPLTNNCLILFFFFLIFIGSTPKTPIELAIDFILHDFEMAGQSVPNYLFGTLFFPFIVWCLNENQLILTVLPPEVEPISTYTEFGDREFLVADERGYEHLLYKMAETFLTTSDGKITDSRLKLNTVKLLSISKSIVL